MTDVLARLSSALAARYTLERELGAGGMGTTPQMVLSAHMTEAPQPVTKHRDTVPTALEAVVMRCLEKKPADRFQSAEELLPQLESLATPSGGVTPTDTGRSRPPQARHERSCRFRPPRSSVPSSVRSESRL